MEQYYMMVIDLYKTVITNLREGMDPDQEMILDVKKALSCGITEAKIKGEAYSELESLLNGLIV